jgi:hypothetical protein
LFDRDVRVDAVAVIEVYVVDTETLERLVASLTDIFWIIAYLARAVWCHIIGKLGGEEDVVALASPLEPSANWGGWSANLAQDDVAHSKEAASPTKTKEWHIRVSK